MALTPEEKTQYEGYLRDAQQAFHDLQIGNSARVVVDQNGERVEYTAANRQNLRSYIIELKIALGLPTGIAGPMRVRPLW